MKWLSVTQLSQVVKTPETTVRRYLNNFQEYFRSEKRGRGKKYHPESVEALQRISLLYSEDYETTEIKEILSNEFAFTVDSDSNHESAIQPPGLNIGEEFKEFKQQQEQFNKQLLKQLKDQQDYINKSIERRDRELLQAIREIQETKKQIATTKEKKWWKFWW